MSGDEVWNVYKTKRCNFADSGCPQGLECRYHHSEADRRRMPPIHYQPFLCIDAITDKHCLHDMCKFCKNYQEYLYHPLNFKTKECIYMKRKLPCVKGIAFCPYYHSSEEKEQFRIFRELLTVKAITEPDVKGYESESEDDTREQGTQVPSLKTSRVNSYAQPDSAVERTGDYFLLGDEIAKYEDRHHEFKSSCSTQLHTSDVTAKYISAFLNTDGGVLYYGVTDSGLIAGVSMTRKARDLFTRNIDVALNKFAPHLAPELVTIKFIDVFKEQKNKLQDVYVVRVTVKPGSKSEIYFTHKGEAYIRRDASVSLLPPQSIIAHYTQRLQEASSDVQSPVV